MKLLENKVAIVTGASRGIGEGIALKLAEHGANVAFTYLSSDEKAKALEERLQSLRRNLRIPVERLERLKPQMEQRGERK